jgi:hypothetical protein
MKCYIHPREDALYECHVCGKPICGDCMKFGEDQEITCPKCTLDADGIMHLEDMEEDERKYAQQAAKIKNRKTLKQRLAVRLNPIFVLILAAIIGLNYYIDHQIGKSLSLIEFSDERLLENGIPAAQFTYVMAKVFQYRDQRGHWPKSLEKLVGKYLDKEPLILKTNDQYNYTTDAKLGFVLSVPKAKRFGFLKLFVSADGEINTE